MKFALGARIAVTPQQLPHIQKGRHLGNLKIFGVFLLDFSFGVYGAQNWPDTDLIHA